MPHPALTITSEFVEDLITSLLTNGKPGEAAANFLRTRKDDLVGIGMAAFKDLLVSFGSGSKSDLYKARTMLIDSMSWDDVIALQTLSSEAALKHTSEKVRLGAVLTEVAKLAENIVPVLVPIALALI